MVRLLTIALNSKETVAPADVDTLLTQHVDEDVGDERGEGSVVDVYVADACAPFTRDPLLRTYRLTLVCVSL